VGKLGGRRRLWVRVAVSAAIAGLIVAAAYGGFGAVWTAWSSGHPTTTITFCGLPMLWWGRVGKLLQFVAGLTVVFDLFGPERLRAVGAHAGDRLAALRAEVKERRAANRLIRLEQWLSDNIVTVAEVPGPVGMTLAVGSASERTSVPADAPFTVAEYQELRAEFLAEHRDRLEDSAAALAQRVRAFMLAHLDPDEAQLLVVRGDRVIDAQVLLIIGLAVGICVSIALVRPVRLMMILVVVLTLVCITVLRPARSRDRLFGSWLFLLYAPIRLVSEFLARTLDQAKPGHVLRWIAVWLFIVGFSLDLLSS
jgi:hypothetical protein